MSDPRHPLTAVAAALNRAADEITVEADLPDEGTRDALNLLVNATLHFLENPNASLADAIRASYDEPNWPDVLGWCQR